MSNDEVPSNIIKGAQALVVDDKEMFPGNDISDEHNTRIQEFIAEGMPGVAKVDDSKMAKMVDLYLSGNTYNQISSATNTSKVLVMYLSQKYSWFQSRQAYLMELQENMMRRVIENNLTHQDFMLTAVQAFQKKITKKMSRYLATNDETHMDGINLKEMDMVLKLQEGLRTSIAPPKSESKAPAVGLNLGDGVTITKKDDNSVEITPKQKVIGDILQKYADLRREEEKK